MPVSNHDYAIQLLTIKQHEWESIKEKWSIEIARHGPQEDCCKLYNEAVAQIEGLKKSIAKLCQYEQHN